MADSQTELRNLFFDAWEFKNVQERARFLDEACRSKPELRARLESLLKAQVDASGFLQEPAQPLAPPMDNPVREGSGSIFGPYKLLEQIGEGGFGLVYMAEQQQPVRRKVAIKLLKPGMDTRQVIARFEAERQALALMDHPNIARVFDAGVSNSGRPFFVMELCRGVPITDYCDSNALTTRERLLLFLAVCQAVQHAHLKGLIHRDIKPSNVLVGQRDGSPVVKMIDFGIAKAIGQQLTDKTLFTGYAEQLGTPLYMSPEQAGMSDLDVDTRSDIYSLGVLLYELLTGTTPFDKERLREAGGDLRRIIREEEPPKPSTRVSTVGRLATTISARRKSDPKRLSQSLRGELDWIVMKALDKDRSRRYQTASAFAADVQNYLQNEPVIACPPSLGYRFRKLARKHRKFWQTAAVAALALLLAAGGIGWSIRDHQARRAAAVQLADDALQQATEFAQQKHWALALAAARRAEGLLAGAGDDPDRHQRLQQLLADLTMVARLEETELQADDARGDAFTSVSVDPAYAKAFAEYGIDVENLSTVEAGAWLAERGIRIELAAALEDWALHRHENRPNDDQSWKQLLRIANLADADPLRVQLREIWTAWDPRKLRELATSISIAGSPPLTLVHLARSLLIAGAPQEALTLLRSARDCYPTDLWINYELAITLKTLRPAQLDEALRYATVAESLRPQSPAVQILVGNALRDKGRYQESLKAYHRALTLHPNFGLAYTNLGIMLELEAIRNAAQDQFVCQPILGLAYQLSQQVMHYQSEREAAMTAHRQALTFQPGQAEPYYNLGVALESRGQLNDAIAAYRQAIQIMPTFGRAYFNLGNALERQGDVAAGVAAYRDAIAAKPDYAKAYFKLGLSLKRSGRLPEAIATFRELVRRQSENEPAQVSLGNALLADHQLDSAIAAYREALRLEPDDANAHSALGTAYLHKKQGGAAMVSYQAALRLRPDDASVYVDLGAAMMMQKQIEAAVSAYRKAIELQPDLAIAHYNLGNALVVQHAWTSAETAYTAAIRLKPLYAEAYCNRAKSLLHQGKIVEALADCRRGHEIGSKIPGWQNHYDSARWIRDYELLAALEERLPALIQGKQKPANPSEYLELARLCTFKQLHGAAAKFFADAFAARPALATERAGHLYQAASAAADAGCGKGKDTPALDKEQQAHWRKQALAWLEADISLKSQQIQSGEPGVRSAAISALEHWSADPTFGYFREGSFSAHIPPGEQEQWRRFWFGVDSLLRSAKGLDHH